MYKIWNISINGIYKYLCEYDVYIYMIYTNTIYIYIIVYIWSIYTHIYKYDIYIYIFDVYKYIHTKKGYRYTYDTNI